MTPSTRPNITVVGDAEQALRRLGNWQAIDEQAAGYYQRFGFLTSPDNPLLLFLPANAIE